MVLLRPPGAQWKLSPDLTVRLVFGSPSGPTLGAVPSDLCPSIVLTFQA